MNRNNNIVQRAFIRLIRGDEKLSMSSVLSIYAGRFLWGSTFVMGDKTVALPDSIHHAREDRVIPQKTDDNPRLINKRVYDNQIRAGIVRMSRNLMLMAAIGMVTLLGIAAMMLPMYLIIEAGQILGVLMIAMLMFFALMPTGDGKQ